MSKLMVVQVVNNNPSIVAEFTDNEQGAIVKFHQQCATLWNAADVYTANIKILNEHLDQYAGYSEYITHPEPEPEEPQNTLVG